MVVVDHSRHIAYVKNRKFVINLTTIRCLYLIDSALNYVYYKRQWILNGRPGVVMVNRLWSTEKFNVVAFFQYEILHSNVCIRRAARAYVASQGIRILMKPFFLTKTDPTKNVVLLKFLFGAIQWSKFLSKFSFFSFIQG